MDILLIALVTFLTGIGYLLIKNGLLVSVTFDTEDVAAMNLAYKLHVGDYAKSAQSMDAVYRELQQQGVTDVTAFGLFYDNPQTTSRETLRSLTGCIIKNASDYEQIEHIKKSVLPASTSLVATFPYKSSFSIAIGAIKVYSALAKHRMQHGTPEVPVMEIYDMDNRQIIYVVLTGLEKAFLEDLVKVS